jgi:hypothetical protein
VDAPAVAQAPPSDASVAEELPVLPSPYVDLAPPARWDSSTPSVFDLLAGAPAAEPEVVGEPADRVDVAADTVAGDPWATPTATPSIDEVAKEPATPPLDMFWRPQPPEPTAPGGGAPVEPSEQGADSRLIPLDEGRFALGGWAASAGHSMVSAVTFRRRLAEDVTPDRIVLEIDASENVPEGGLVVLADPGFAPDRDGFTLLLAAAYPGPFSAAGSYRVLPPA